jgi:hypothetical protein
MYPAPFRERASNRLIIKYTFGPFPECGPDQRIIDFSEWPECSRGERSYRALGGNCRISKATEPVSVTTVE